MTNDEQDEPTLDVPPEDVMSPGHSVRKLGGPWPPPGHVLCDVCSWQPDPHVCPAVRMTEAEEAEVLAVLERGPVGVGHWGYCSLEVFPLQDGWEVAIFNDCGEWDYVEWVQAPDGRRWDFPFDTLRPLTQRLADWRPSGGALRGWVINPDDVSLD